MRDFRENQDLEEMTDYREIKVQMETLDILERLVLADFDGSSQSAKHAAPDRKVRQVQLGQLVLRVLRVRKVRQATGAPVERQESTEQTTSTDLLVS